jgi:hypothetical protein
MLFDKLRERGDGRPGDHAANGESLDRFGQ